MNLKFEKRNTFYVSGYSMETSEESLEKDCLMLREKYEDRLRSVSHNLYFLSWATKEGVMVYHFGVETTSKAPVTEGANCIEVPATCFAVATVPEGAPILTTWHEFFEKGLSSLGADIDMDYRFFFESFDENGVCRLWIPVRQK